MSIPGRLEQLGVISPQKPAHIKLQQKVQPLPFRSSILSVSRVKQKIQIPTPVPPRIPFSQVLRIPFWKCMKTDFAFESLCNLICFLFRRDDRPLLKSSLHLLSSDLNLDPFGTDISEGRKMSKFSPTYRILGIPYFIDPV